MNLDDAIAEVARARKRLEAEQGRIARKNARQAVKLAVGAVLRAMDREYPLVRKERVVRVAMTPLAKKRRERAKRVTMLDVTSVEAVTLAAAGIKLVVDPSTPAAYEAPSWAARALRARVSSAEIRSAVHSRKVRARIEAYVRLRSANEKFL